jgi:HPt (histidine-containing phosphotransfer) domain-containing protein
MKVTLDSFYSGFTPAYLASRKAELVTLTQLVAVADFEKLQSRFHKIRGSGGGFGLIAISSLARDVEHAAESRDLALVGRAFLRYETYIAALELDFQASRT